MASQFGAHPTSLRSPSAVASSFCCPPCPPTWNAVSSLYRPPAPANPACHSRLTSKNLLGQPQAPGFPFSERSCIALCCPRLLLGWDLASEPVFPSLPVSTTLQGGSAQLGTLGLLLFPCGMLARPLDLIPNSPVPDRCPTRSSNFPWPEQTEFLFENLPSTPSPSPNILLNSADDTSHPPGYSGQKARSEEAPKKQP